MFILNFDPKTRNSSDIQTEHKSDKASYEHGIYPISFISALYLKEEYRFEILLNSSP